YDRDGDAIVDKDGVPLSIELLLQAGNPVNTAFAAKYQENLARAGIKLTVTSLDQNTLVTRRKDRDFDAYALGWAPPIESDPEQLWHSRSARSGSNFSGVMDAAIDGLIETGQRELDAGKRHAIWRELHRRL